MDQLLLTKLHAPPLRPGLVRRARLTGRLNRSLALGCRLTLISAPAGYGKTTLACEWLAALAADESGPTAVAPTVCWLALDSADNDPARWFTYLVTALRRFDPRLGQATLGLLSAPRLPAAHTLITPLINDISLVSGSVILVLDDLHAIHNLAIHDALDFLVQHAPPNLHVVVLTREDPPLSLPTLRARGQLTELRMNDLRFSDEEAGAFFEATMGLALETSVVHGLEARTEGWVAGLQLAALSVQSCPAEELPAFLAAFSGSDRYIMDYLLEQVLRQLPPDIRSFMVTVSVLDRMCAGLCDALAGGDADGCAAGNSKALLQQLDAANLFLVRLDAQGHWFRFHHLFAELLRFELDPGQQAALHRRAARWLEEKGLLPEAIHHALAGGDASRAGRLVGQVAEDLLRTSELRTLLGWIDRLPPRLVLDDPELAVHRAAALFFTGEAQSAFDCLDQVESGGADRAIAPHIRGRLLALRAWQANLAYDMPAVRRAAVQALDLLGEDQAFYRMIALLPLGFTQSAAGETLQAEQTFRETVRLGRQAGHALAAIAGLVNVAFNLLEQGQVRAAAELALDTLAGQIDRRGVPLPLAQVLYLPLATICYQANRLAEAQEHAARGLEAAAHVLSEDIMGGDGEMTLVLADFALGRSAAAFERCEATRARAERLGYQRVAFCFAALHAELCLREGNLAAARRWAQGRRAALAGPLAPARELEYRVYSRYLVAEGQLGEALDLLHRMEAQARSGGRQARLVITLIWEAIAQRRLRDDAAAVRALAEAVRLAAPENLLRVFLDSEPLALAQLLPKVRPVAPEFVDALLGAASGGRVQAGSNLAAADQLLPEPLTARELEVLRLLAQGLTYRQVAAQLIVAQGTVQAHCGSVYGKLGVNNRTQALTRARELRLL